MTDFDERLLNALERIAESHDAILAIWHRSEAREEERMGALRAADSRDAIVGIVRDAAELARAREFVAAWDRAHPKGDPS